MDDGLILKRGLTEVRINGRRNAELVRAILGTCTEVPTTVAELVAHAQPFEAAQVQLLVKDLRDRRLLLPDGEQVTHAEDEVDIYLWQVGSTRAELKARFPQTSVVGANAVSRALVTVLRETGIEDVTLVGFGPLDDDRGADTGSVPYADWKARVEADPPGLIVPTAASGGLHLLRPWNEFCVEEGIELFPVVVQNLTGYVGPRIVPHQTACFECVRARQNSHLRDPAGQRAAERFAPATAHVAGHHPAMQRLVGEVAALELQNIHGQLAPYREPALVEINLHSLELVRRAVRRAPLCPVCGGPRRTPEVNLFTRIYGPTDA